jgi:hypothetical protein
VQAAVLDADVMLGALADLLAPDKLDLPQRIAPRASASETLTRLKPGAQHLVA